MPESSLDQVTPITDLEIIEIDSVREFVEQAAENGDIEPVFQEIQRDKASIRTKGVKLMHWLYQIKKHWEDFGFDLNTFEDDMFIKTGFSQQTIRKYTRIWESIFQNEDIPAERKLKLLMFPVMSLYYLLSPINEGVLTEEHWEAIEQSPDRQTIREVSKELLGERTSSGTAITILYDTSTGDLIVKHGTDRKTLGWLNAFENDEDIRKAVTRIISSSGILELN